LLLGWERPLIFPDTNSWITDVDHKYELNVMASPDNSVWLWSSGDSKIWQAIPVIGSGARVSPTYELTEPLYCSVCSRGIEDMVLADDRLWIVYHRSGLPHGFQNFGYFDLRTKEWAHVQSVELFGYNRFTALAQAPDGSFWLGTLDGFGHFTPTGEDLGKSFWTYYSSFA
jgi:hypothetical protein